jgi:hypothetical protein
MTPEAASRDRRCLFVETRYARTFDQTPFVYTR